ncbi:MAG: O-antigen ligase family protein [Muribaculum sp.]|nr:O-antigen ligase family protein [Muribaculum sp.]
MGKGISGLLKINIETINFLLIFIGFPIFTAFISNSAASVAYRGLACMVGLVCIARNIHQWNMLRRNKPLIFFIIIYALLTLKIVYEMEFGEDAFTPYTNSKMQLMLFVFGIGWIPFLGAILGYSRVDKEKVLRLSTICLLLLMLYGIVKKNINTGATGRISLTEHQSSLAFGDNAGYLVILSVASYFYPIKRKIIDNSLAIAGFVVGFYAMLIAGSRGPVISAVCAVIFIFATLRTGIKFKYGVIFASAILISGVGVETIQEISPVLYDRMNSTIESGDTSGRDILFVRAWDKIMESPIIGSNPIILGNNGFVGYHNVYLTTGVGLGIFGFVAYILFLVYLSGQSINLIKSKLSTWDIVIMALLWFSIVRGITGINMVTNCLYSVTIAYNCIVIKNRAYECKKVSYKDNF